MTVLILLLCCGCQSEKKTSDETVKEDPVQSETEKEAISRSEISDEEVYELYLKDQRFVETNFYVGTPEWELDCDYERMDKETFAAPALKCHSIAEFKAYMKDNYDLSDAFINRLIDLVFSSIYEKDDELWIMSAGRGTDIFVGNETGHEVIRKEDKIVLRVSHEQLEINADGTENVKGTFDTDNILVYEDGRWVFDDIPSFR